MDRQKLRCIIVDDEPLAGQLLSAYVRRTDGLELLGCHTSAREALDDILSNHPDIAFLDIQMPEISGMDMARRIPDDVKVVFTTAYREYAVEGFRVNALDYLLKPVSYDEFIEAVQRARNQTKSGTVNETQSEYLSVRSEHSIVRIPVRDIQFIEGLKDYVKIHIHGFQRPVLTLMSIKSLEQTLPVEKFMRVHRSYIINLDHVTALRSRRIVIDDKREVPVSDTFKSALSARLGL